MGDTSDNAKSSMLSQSWVMICGAILGALTLVFLMALVFFSINGREIPCNSVFLLSATLSFGSALSAAFLGGSASARGSLSLPGVTHNPILVSFGGGIAVLFAMLLLSTQLFDRTDCRPVAISCAVGFQAQQVSQLKFSFCYPREGWEVDVAAINLNAGDVYLRNSENRDVGIHFHVSTIPAAWINKPEEYTYEVMKTWRQIDNNISVQKTFIGGIEVRQFRLVVKDRMERNRPTLVTHAYIDSERLLEIFVTAFQDTPNNVNETMAKVLSSLSILRI